MQPRRQTDREDSDARRRPGDEELALDKLNSLITLKYGSAKEVKKALGDVAAIRAAFVGFQRYLYEG